ncbi:WD40-repeat-containing domain protein [Rhypophila sp. PSN 637]
MSAYLQQKRNTAAHLKFGGFNDADSDQSMDDAGAESQDESADGEGWLQGKKGKTHTQTAELSDKDSDEEDLERFVLGNKDAFREQLFRDDFLGFLDQDSAAGKELVPAGQTNDLANAADSSLFAFDTVGSGIKYTAEKSAAEEEPEQKPAWEDSDDERLTVSLASTPLLRKLRTTEAEDLISGTEYTRRLRQQYLRLYPTPAWAKEAEAKQQGKKAVRRRRSSVASNSESDSDEENLDPSALPLESFLRNAANFTSTDSSSRKRRKLRPETLDIQRTRDIPDSHKAAVASLSFHPTRPILLSASTSSIMYLHHIDASAHPVPNPRLTSVQVQSTDVRRSEFVGPTGSEVIFAGRRRYFHSWNLSTGLVKKVSQIHGGQAPQNTMENFRASPDGKALALISSEKKGGGVVNILNAKTMQWIAAARVNGRGGVSDCQWWRDSSGLSILGKDGGITEWSLTAKRAVGVWKDQGSIGGTVMALSGNSGGPKELGGDRWIAVGSNSGICNIYKRSDLLLQGDELAKRNRDLKEEGIASSMFGVEVMERPAPSRVLDQLTTAISTVRFSGDGQILAFASEHKKDALRLVHLPSCTVYRNWPTEQTPLGRVSAVAFGTADNGDGAEILAVGNDMGKIRMWEIRA